MSEKDQDTVTITTEQDTELEETLSDIEDVEALKSQIAEKDTFARQAIARAKKAEEENKALKAKVSETATHINQPSLSEETVDIKILTSQGLDEDAIKYLQKVAKVNGTSVIEAQSDEVYKTWKSNKEVEAKAEKARVGASRGSGSVKVDKSLSTPGLTDAEHKELWLKSNGR